MLPPMSVSTLTAADRSVTGAGLRPRRRGWFFDHDGRGQITSGLQLFGNVTFWIFWQNGLRCTVFTRRQCRRSIVRLGVERYFALAGPQLQRQSPIPAKSGRSLIIASLQLIAAAKGIPPASLSTRTASLSAMAQPGPRMIGNRSVISWRAT